MNTKHKLSNKTPAVISVITVVFNGKKLIQKTIESVLHQTYANIEFVIIDGASTDGTLNIIKSYNGRIDKWISKKDSGIYDAMNKGIASANGDYLLFLNAGDVFSNDSVLELVASSIVSNSYPEVLYGETNILDKYGAFIKKLPPLRFTQLNLLLFGTRTVCHQSIFVRKNFAPSYVEIYRIKGDLYWYFDMFKKNTKLNAILLPYPIANYLLGGLADASFGTSLKETIQVIFKTVGFIGVLIGIPFLMIPIVFRLKQIVLNYFRYKRDKESNA